MDSPGKPGILKKTMDGPNERGERDELEQHTPPKEKGSRLLYLGGFVLVLACVIAVPLYSSWHHTEVPKPVPTKPPVTVTAISAKVTRVVDAPGKLTLYRYVDVGAQVAGQVKDVLVPVGETVKSGRLLVEIKPPPDTAHVEGNRAQLARLNADLADQTAQYDFAQLQFQRQTR